MNEREPMGIPNVLIQFVEVFNKARVKKIISKTNEDLTTHLWDWIEKSTAWSWVFKVKYTNANETIEWRPMMCMSYAMVEKKHVGKQLTTYYSALRWAKANNGQPTRLPMANGMSINMTIIITYETSLILNQEC